MTVDPEQLLSDGYIILHDVIPSDEIEKLRLTFETLVTRQRELWSRERKVGDPPGGVWESGAQPRLQFDTLVSKDTSA
ncbi:MAG: hypothetical protein HOH43_22165, partial [Candidatus Latescibacteria bacterium]|nr:hypothetical protein [Candidatus Latescibacterota bacterium]